MTLILGEETEPSTPPDGKVYLYADAADGHPKVKRSSGAKETLGRAPDGNVLANSCFWFCQRQAPSGANYDSSVARAYCADRWAVSVDVDSATYARIDTASSPQTGLSSRFYGSFTKITSTGKIMVSQVIEGTSTMPFRGRKVTIQMVARNGVGTHTLRLGLVQLTSAGTIDTIPTFFSTLGASGTNPTFGTNLSLVAPATASAACTIVSSALHCVLGAAFTRYSGTWVVPSDCKNLAAVVWSESAMTASQEFHIGEMGFFDGDTERDLVWTSYTEELQRVQRYYQKTFGLDVAPASSLGSNNGEFRFCATVAGAATNRSPAYQFPVRMRASPTIVLYNPSAAGSELRDQTALANCTASATANPSDHGFNVTCTGAAGTTVGGWLAFHATMSAEL